jgi:DsbC/DsbD-like thiol-disulfide interchange protein
MRQILAGVCVFLAAGVGIAALAQSHAASQSPSIKNPVTVRGKYVSLVVGSSATTAAPGARVTLLVRVTPGPKIHVYAPGQDGYLPIDLSVVDNPAFVAKATVYPAPTPFTFAPTAETVKVYAPPFLLREDLVLASSAYLKRRAASGDTLTVVGAFEYQACDDAVCYRPETVPVEWKLKLVPVAR